MGLDPPAGDVFRVRRRHSSFFILLREIRHAQSVVRPPPARRPAVAVVRPVGVIRLGPGDLRAGPVPVPLLVPRRPGRDVLLRRGRPPGGGPPPPARGAAAGGGGGPRGGGRGGAAAPGGG